MLYLDLCLEKPDLERLAGPVWTGIYGGVSLGLMSMQAKAASVQVTVKSRAATSLLRWPLAVERETLAA